mmetsp:Transcript_9316/g.30278  ORF Transcript_9316/g.30278 Transcript_9316/m.30278 type:complete len:171 (+) Transcript_9316:1345-1857(+)
MPFALFFCVLATRRVESLMMMCHREGVTMRSLRPYRVPRSTIFKDVEVSIARYDRAVKALDLKLQEDEVLRRLLLDSLAKAKASAEEKLAPNLYEALDWPSTVEEYVAYAGEVRCCSSMFRPPRVTLMTSRSTTHRWRGGCRSSTRSPCGSGSRWRVRNCTIVAFTFTTS